MGRFIREQLQREGVSIEGVAIDPDRLTALVLLAVEDEGVSPMIFYRDNCADMALSPENIDGTFIASAGAIVVTGTHFSRPNSDAAQRKAIEISKRTGGRVVFDIDYRPNLWGLAGHAAGFERYVKSDRVSGELRTVLPHCDLIVGTEEEIMIASGADSVLASLKAIRELTQATIVLKRGAMGCIVYDGAISDDLEDGIVGQGFPIEVYNVLGAGDAFMSGLLRGWLRGEPLATCATWANACGAFAVSRLLCSPEYPTWDELQYFLRNGSPHRALRKDRDINHIHWATTRRAQPAGLMALAIDHRAQLEEIADRASAPHELIASFKALAVEATARVARGRPGFGMLLDSTYGAKALFQAAKHGFWIGRPVEQPGSRPLDFDHLPDLGSHLAEWPIGHTIKCLCFYHPDDPPELRQRQERELLRLDDAARTVGRELLVEIIAGKHGSIDDTTVARVVQRLYDLGIKPDWWKLEPQASVGAWRHIAAAISRSDPYCRGIVMLGLDAPESDLVEAFRIAASNPMVKGFAVGRTIFAETAARWFERSIDDEAAIAEMARKFERLVGAWQDAARTEAA